MIIFVGEQFWCLNGSTLKNKANIFKTNDTLNLVDNIEGTMYFIRNVSNNTSDGNEVLGLKDDEVVLEVKVPNKAGQLWIKGEDMAGGYTTLKHYESSKVLTATFDGLKAKGNY